MLVDQLSNGEEVIVVGHYFSLRNKIYSRLACEFLGPGEKIQAMFLRNSPNEDWGTLARHDNELVRALVIENHRALPIIAQNDPVEGLKERAHEKLRLGVAGKVPENDFSMIYTSAR